MNHLRDQWRRLAQRTYYHVSPARLAIGTVLVPAGGRPNFDGRADSNWVYMTDNEYDAERIGNAIWHDDLTGPRIYVYEVQPHGEVTEGTTQVMIEGFYENMQELMAESATVTKLLYSYDPETGEAKYAKTARAEVQFLDYFGPQIFWIQARAKDGTGALAGKIEGVMEDGKYVPEITAVNPRYKGKGVARALMEYLFKQAGGRQNIIARDFTHQGAAFWKALTGEDVEATQQMDFGTFDWDDW